MIRTMYKEDDRVNGWIEWVTRACKLSRPSLNRYLSDLLSYKEHIPTVLSISSTSIKLIIRTIGI